MKKFRYEIIIFIVEAVCMILELVASRILSPYFGSSNIVWTSVIGIILFSSSIGNYFGGIIADKKEVTKKLKIILILTSIFILLIPIIQTKAIKLVINIVNNIKVGAIISTILLFFIPSMLMGLLSPIIVKLKLEDLENAGRVSGKIRAIATLGGIVGTFLGGFVLIPNFGTINILLILNILVVCLIPMVDMKIKDKNNIFVIIMIIITITYISAYSEYNKIASDLVKNNDFSDYVSYDTQYGRVLIYNRVVDNENCRILNIDSGYESMTYTDDDKIYDLVFPYLKGYDAMFKSSNDINNVLMIGGGGYSYPKYYISHYEDKNMDVVEIDEGVTKIAKKYFYLDKLIEDYDLENTKRLNLINDDGRVFLNNNTKKYDAILNDSFSGNSPAKGLTTLEAVQEIKKSLVENGVYLTNIISSVEGNNSKFLKAEVNTIKQVFKNVYVIPTQKDFDKNKYFNIIVVATDDTIDFEDEYIIDINQDEIILTDNYCPVDTLIPLF